MKNYQEADLIEMEHRALRLVDTLDRVTFLLRYGRFSDELDELPQHVRVLAAEHQELIEYVRRRRER